MMRFGYYAIGLSRHLEAVSAVVDYSKLLSGLMFQDIEKLVIIPISALATFSLESLPQRLYYQLLC